MGILKVRIAKDGDGFGVQTFDNIKPHLGWLFENEKPLTKTEAEKLAHAINHPDESNDRYWAMVHEYSVMG